MKPSPKLRKELRVLIAKWRPRLYLNEWHIDLNFPMEGPEESGGMTVLAEIDACPVYLTARINVYPAWFERGKDAREKTIVHELCHCLTQEMSNLVSNLQNSVLVTHPQRIDAVEKLTQRLTHIALYQAGA